MIVRIQNVDNAATITDERPGIVQLPGATTLAAPATERASLEIEFLNAMIAKLAHVEMSLVVEGEIVRIRQLALFAPGSAPMFY